MQSTYQFIQRCFIWPKMNILYFIKYNLHLISMKYCWMLMNVAERNTPTPLAAVAASNWCAIVAIQLRYFADQQRANYSKLNCIISNEILKDRINDEKPCAHNNGIVNGIFFLIGIINQMASECTHQVGFVCARKNGPQESNIRNFSLASRAQPNQISIERFCHFASTPIKCQAHTTCTHEIPKTRSHLIIEKAIFH